jgi:hypothetical protein
MQSSASVAALASALAKAQAELVNPEKSLTATLPAERGQPERSFRYAPLAGGLDIVRKTLGRHEIAAIQATSIDRDSGTVKLTTTLAHSSGEWLASDWPVCPLSDLSTPRRMGAALTYARRYALFTLVGIAGEDDLDAPDLPTQSVVPTQAPSPQMAPSPSWHRKNGKVAVVSESQSLSAEESEQQRDQLLAELPSLGSADEAAQWAKRILPIKNTLTQEHASEVEAAFAADLVRFDGMADPDIGAPTTDGGKDVAFAENNTPSGSITETAGDRGVPLLRPVRRRDKDHLKFVAAQPCLLCQRRPCDAHHLRFAQPRAMGRKVSDEFTVPLCRTHHRQVHRVGNEAEWWTAMDPDIDPLEVAKGLWEQSRTGIMPTR